MVMIHRIALGLILVTLLALPVVFYTFEGLYLYSVVKSAWLASLALVLLAVLAAERYRSRLSLRPADGAELALWVFLGWTALAGFVAQGGMVNGWVALQQWLFWLAGACAFWFVRRLRQEEILPPLNGVSSTMVVMVALLAGSGMVVLFGSLQGLDVGIPKALDQYGNRLPTSSMGHANYAAQAALPFLAVPLAVFLVTRRRGVAVGGLAVAFLALPFLLATQSRGALVALGAGMVVVAALVGLVQWRRGERPDRVIAFLAFLPLLGGVAALLQPEWMARLLLAFDPAQASTADRLHLWRDSVSAIAANPWFGFGPGQFLYVFPEYWSEDTARQILRAGSRLVENPHQDGLALALGGGLPAAGAFLAFCSLVLHRAWNSFTMKDEDAVWKWGALAVVLVWLAYGLIDYPLHGPVPLFAFFVVMGLLAPVAPAQEREASRPGRYVLAPLVLTGALVVGALVIPGLVRGVGAQAHAVRAGELLHSNPARAFHYASLAVERDGRNPLAHSIHGQARLLRGAGGRSVDYGAVEASLQEALRWYPVDFQTRYNLGVARYQRALDQGGSTRAARREFQQVLALNPYYAKAYYMLASLDARAGAPWGQVEENLAFAVEREPALLRAAARAPEFQSYREAEDALRRWTAAGRRE